LCGDKRVMATKRFGCLPALPAIRLFVIPCQAIPVGASNHVPSPIRSAPPAWPWHEPAALGRWPRWSGRQTGGVPPPPVSVRCRCPTPSWSERTAAARRRCWRRSHPVALSAPAAGAATRISTTKGTLGWPTRRQRVRRPPPTAGAVRARRSTARGRRGGRPDADAVDGGVVTRPLADVEHRRVMSQFTRAPERMLRHLFGGA
jgi:hypothetical protein